MGKRLGLSRLEKLVEELNRNIDLEGSDVTVNTLTADLGITATAGGLTVSAGKTSLLSGDLPLIVYQRGGFVLADDNAVITDDHSLSCENDAQRRRHHDCYGSHGDRLVG